MDIEPVGSAPSRHRSWPALLAIALIVAVLALVFAWVAGWLTPNRLTPQRFTNAIETSNGQIYRGFRRAHAKGVCVAGYFEGNGKGVALSSARLFATVRTPFVGRLSIGGGSPHGLDGKARVRSMALELNSDDGQQWRMAMNSFPFFGVSTVQAFYEQTRANAPDPGTGKPDPTRQAAFAQDHPEFARFAAWAKSAPWSTSWANTTYNGVNTFRFVNRAGELHNVRWSMLPQTAFAAMTPEQRAAVDGNFLSADLDQRLAQGPLRWYMVVTVAIELVIGFAFAMVMHKVIFARGIIRTSILIPYGIITVVSGFAWQFAFSYQNGFVNQWLPFLGDQFNWFGETTPAVIAIMVSEIWKTTPFMSLLLLAGLAQVSEDMLEAAQVDGATWFQRLFKVILPNMQAAIMVAVLFRALDAYRIFDNIFVMTNGAVGTESISFLTYRQTIEQFQLGIGSALSVLLFLSVLLVAWLIVKLFRVDLAQARQEG